MGYWNNRVVRYKSDNTNGWSGYLYDIREVHYENNGTIKSWTVEPVQVDGECFGDLVGVMGGFLAALRRPVLEIVIKNGKEKLVQVDDPDLSNEFGRSMGTE